MKNTGLKVGTWRLVEQIWRTFDLIVVKVNWDIRCMHLKMDCISKTARCRAKRIEMWGRVTLVTFELAVFKTILGLFSDLVSKWYDGTFV